MAVTTPTGAITGTTGTTGSSTTGSTNATDGLGKDTFLKLLVAQMKYQNPLSPTDGTQYLSQMAEFSTVEKLADLQKSQTELATWQRNVAGQGMIGKTITATTTTGATSNTVTGVVTGLRLTDAGPRLVLADGTTVGVDDVTDVTAPSGSSPAASSASGTTASSTTASGTTASGTTASGTAGSTAATTTSGSSTTT
jgi:flagellar basal-body rod modification protein FlgD